MDDPSKHPKNHHHNHEQEEEEEDYMGDLSLFLPSENLTSATKPRKPPPSKPDPPKPKKPRTMTWQEHRELDRNRKQLEEDERTMAGMGAAIPETNIGFRMLRSMGYSPGSSLGGRMEPVGLEIRRSRAGIGKETPAEERRRKGREREERERRKEADVADVAEEFGAWQRMQFRCRKVVRDFRKAEAVLARLEDREDEVEEEKEKGEEDGEGKEEEEEEEEVITEEDLRSILVKLRGEHRYCLYCGFQYESMEDLEANCPGVDEEDH